jgi:hypothetical protein
VTLPRYPSFLERESRIFAWADTHTLIVFAGIEGGKGNGAAGTVFKYDLATGKALALAGIVNAVEGVVRCSTIFWIELSDLTSSGSTQQTYSYRGQAYLHRYHLGARAPVGAPIPLGDTSVNTGDSWVVDWPGWDVSGDGALVVYQQMTASFDGKQNNLTSTFKEANADGSGTRIVLAGPMTVMSSGPVRLAISPDGRQVALTTPASDIVSEPFVGAGVKAYSPPAAGLPAWLPNDSGFVATSHDPKSPAGVYQYWSGTPALGPNGSIPGIELGEGGTNPATLL